MGYSRKMKQMAITMHKMTCKKNRTVCMKISELGSNHVSRYMKTKYIEAKTRSWVGLTSKCTIILKPHMDKHFL